MAVGEFLGGLGAALSGGAKGFMVDQEQQFTRGLEEAKQRAILNREKSLEKIRNTAQRGLVEYQQGEQTRRAKIDAKARVDAARESAMTRSEDRRTEFLQRRLDKLEEAANEKAVNGEVVTDFEINKINGIRKELGLPPISVNESQETVDVPFWPIDKKRTTYSLSVAGSGPSLEGLDAFAGKYSPKKAH